MNCANHPDRERSAFCQNCGKPLCNECIRTTGSSIYCEPCYAMRSAPPPPPGGVPYPPPHGVPNPALAALLGFIPGVGAMYNEQYAKGVVHLMVFAVLVSLSHDIDIFGLFVAGWIFYMVIEAHHTARARRDGTPLPNPFGLNDIDERFGFGKGWHSGGAQQPGYTPPPQTGYAAPPNPDPMSQPTGGQDPTRTTPPANPYAPPYTYTYVPPVAQWAAPPQQSYVPPEQSYVPPVPPIPPVPPVPPADGKVPYAHRFPSGAIWLIVLGVFFLVGNLGMFHIVHVRYLGPVVLIGFGVWTFVHRMTSTGLGMENDGTPYYRWRVARAVRGSIWIVFTGVIWLLDALRIIRWSHSWPLYLIAGGILMFIERAVPMGFDGTQPPVVPGSGVPPAAGTSIVPSTPQDHEEGR